MPTIFDTLLVAVVLCSQTQASFFGGSEHVHVRIHVPVIHHETQHHKEVHYHHHTKQPHHEPAHGSGSDDAGYSNHASLLQHHQHQPQTQLSHQHQYTPVGHPVTLTGFLVDDGSGGHGHGHGHGHSADGLTTVTGVVIGEEPLHGQIGHGGNSHSGLSAGYEDHHPQHEQHSSYDFSAVQNAFHSAQQDHGFTPSAGGPSFVHQHYQSHVGDDSGHQHPQQQYGAPVAAALSSSSYEQQHSVYGVPPSATSFGHDEHHYQQQQPVQVSSGYANIADDHHSHAQHNDNNHGYAVTDTYADSFAGGYDDQQHHGSAISPSQDSYITALGYSGATAHHGQQQAQPQQHKHDDIYSGPDSYSAAPSGAHHHQQQHQHHDQGYEYSVPQAGIGALHH